MPCSHVNGVIVCAARQRRRRCHACILWSSFQCDFPLGGDKTCDKPMCAQHATEVGGPGRHYCRQHVHAKHVPEQKALFA
jgi:hypothetical protein